MALAATLATGANAATTPADGSGSVTVSITEPIPISGTANTTVSCTAGRVTYVASASTVPIKGYTLGFSVAAPYHGPGTYPGVLTLQLTEPNGTTVTLPAASAPTTIDATGGSFTVDATTPGGTPIDGSISWTCSM
jgi:hypothetical protein